MRSKEFNINEAEGEYNGVYHQTVDIVRDEPGEYNFCYDCKLVSTTLGEIEVEDQDETTVVCPRCGSEAYFEASDEEIDKYQVEEDIIIDEHELVWAKTKKGPTMKWRCLSGPRKGRVVPKVIDCSEPIDVAQRARMKVTRARTKIRQARKAKRTKRINPTSRLVRMLNKIKKH